MDLIAAGRAALTPDDDLTLACLLKSPLIGLDDDALYALAADRTGSLAGALAASDEDAGAEGRGAGSPNGARAPQGSAPTPSTPACSARTAAARR